MLKLGDCFIGNFRLSQGFGENPEYYKKFGLAGHEGLDFATPTGTPIVSATDGVVIRDLDNPVQGKNLGIYVTVWDKEQQCATYYCHLASNVVSVGQSVVKGQLLGFSDNTGNSTGPHLHFSLVKTDDKGNRINTDNGYGGFINPNDKRIAEWEIKNLTEPVKPSEIVVPAQPSVDEARAMDVLRMNFLSLPEGDKYKDGNIEGYSRGITEEHLKFADNERKAKQFEVFVDKWFEEWGLTGDPNKSHQIILEGEMSKYISLVDSFETLRTEVEKVTGSFDSDDALLKALSAVKDNAITQAKTISDQGETIAELKRKQNIKFTFSIFGFPVKVYEKEVKK